MPIFVAKQALIVVDHVFDLQYTVIVGVYPGHDTRPRGGTRWQRRMTIGEPDATPCEPIDIGSDGLIGIYYFPLKTIGHKNEEIGAVGHAIRAHPRSMQPFQ